MSEFDDFLAPADPTPSRPKMSDDEIERRLQARKTEGEITSAAGFLKPVTTQFLSQVFGIHANTVQKRLARCPVEHYGVHKGNRSARYDFRVACQYLVEPKTDIADWIQNQEQFPPRLQKAFWSGQREKQRWQLEAGELWHTEDVVEVLGRTFIRIKEASRQWADQLPGKEDLTTEQYQALQKNVLDLLDEIHHTLIEMPKEGRTESVLADIQEEDDA
jgi:plasmid maintenance system killer protein